MRSTLHGPQRYLERCVKSFGGGSCDAVLDGSWKGAPDELDGFTSHVSKARSKTRMFKGLNSPCQGGRIVWCHAVNASTFWVLSRSALTIAADLCLRHSSPGTELRSPFPGTASTVARPSS